VWVVCGIVAIVPVVIAVVRGVGPDDAVPIVVESGIVAAVGSLAVLAGTVVGVLVVQERALFRYFKRR
jgi:Na+/H+ antiporter NhaD/arsenite permease-like protein